MEAPKEKMKRRHSKSAASTSRQQSSSVSQRQAFSRSVTRTKTQVDAKGWTTEVKEGWAATTTHDKTDRVVNEVLQEFSLDCQEIEHSIMEKTPQEVIASNPYLTWRRNSVLRSCQSFTKWGNHWNVTDMSYIFHQRPKTVQGEGFLVRFPWGKVYEYGKLLFQNDEEPSETAFLNDYMAARYVDRLVFHFGFGDPDDALVWPVCLTEIGPIEDVPWGAEGTVKVTRDMQFAFPFHAALADALHGYSFAPPKIYFPLDLLRLHPALRQTYQTTLERDRRKMLPTMPTDIGFQHRVAVQMKPKIK